MISTIITKSNSINKVVDLRDKLILSKTEDYAQMHGIGGKDHNPNSTIQATVKAYQLIYQLIRFITLLNR